MRLEIYIDSYLTHSMILDSISRRLVVVWNLQNSFPAASFPRENWLPVFSFFSTALSISFHFHQVLGLLAFRQSALFAQTYFSHSLHYLLRPISSTVCTICSDLSLQQSAHLHRSLPPTICTFCSDLSNSILSIFTQVMRVLLIMIVG